MKFPHHAQKSILSRTVGILLTSSFVLGALPAIAQANLRLNLPNLRAPGNRESGATRSTSCIDPDENLIALVPESNYGLTQSGYPTFHFYLPPTDAPLVKFIMYDEETNDLFYEGQFSVKGDSGIVSVSLPDNGLQKPLEVGKSYIWYITVVCDPDAVDQSGNAVVEATIARTTSPSGLAQASARDLAQIYAEAGLWYDALTISAELKQAADSTSWNALLDAIELDSLIPVQVLSEETILEDRSVSVFN